MKTLLLPGLFVVILLAGCSPTCPPSGIQTYPELVSELGHPAGEPVVKIYEGMSLHEYQSGLYRFVRKGDTVLITQSVWELGDTKFIAWRRKGSQQIIDRLRIPPGVQY
jgi:hypothetical protein